MKAIRNRKRLMYNKKRYKHLLESFHNSLVEKGTEVQFLTRMVVILARRDKIKIKKAAFVVYDEMIKETHWDRDVLDFYLMQAGDDE